MRNTVVVGETDLLEARHEQAAPTTARSLQERLLGAFSPRKVVSGPGLPLVLALRTLMLPFAHTLPDASKLLAEFGKTPAFDSLEQLGRRHGLALTQHAAFKLHRMAFPAVLMLRNGSAVPVLRRMPSGRYLLATEAGEQVVSGKWLARESAGTAFSIQRIAAAETSQRYSAFANLSRLAGLVLTSSRTLQLQVLAAAIVSNLLLIVLPLFITVVYDRVVPYGAFETLTALTVGVLIVFAVDVGLRMARVNLQEALGVGISQSLQAQFYRKLVRSPLSNNRSGASGVSAILSEMDAAALAMPALLVSLAADLPFVIVMLVLVSHLGGSVVIAPLIGVVIVAAITAIGSRRARAAAGIAHHLKVKIQDQAAETTSMLATIKASRAEGQLITRWNEAIDSANLASHTSRQTSAWAAQASLVATQVVIALTVVLGAIEITSGAITLGNLAACVLLVGRVIAPANSIVSNIGVLANMRNAVGGFLSVIDREEEAGGDQQALNGRQLEGRIDLHALRFTYQGSPRPSLDGVTLSIQPGERIGIIGRNGCGKSTLLKLLVRLHEPDGGTLLFDNINAAQLPPQHLRRHASLMAQDTVLLNSTLRDNITMGMDAVDPAAFESAVRLSGVADFARRHAQGYSAAVGPRGENLSGGERQAVGLARALLNSPSILLLDEPTSAMDSTAEGRLIQQLPAFLAGRTTIIATHRLQMLALVDRIIWMEDGRIIADGPKASVLNALNKAA